MGEFLKLLAVLGVLFVINACTGSNSGAAETQAVSAATLAADGSVKEISAGEVRGAIGVLLPDSASSARWEADDHRFFEQAFDAAGVEYTIVNAEGDARTQQTQAEQAITNGAKVLLLVNLDSGSGAAIIAQAREAGVKVIDYDRLTIEGPGADIYVSFDNVSVGRLMGETLQPVIDGLGLEKPRVVLLNGSPTDNNATLFAEGYKSIADPKFEAGDWEKVDEQAVPDWDNQQALVIYEQILTAAGGEVDATFAANDGLAGSVISALQGQGFDPIPLSGQDATVGGIQNILSGWQTMTVYKPIKLEAAAAAAAAIRLLQGEEPSAITSDVLNNGTRDVPFIKLTPLAVTKDNIAETVIADGFRTWDEICVGEFEAACPEDRDAAAATDGEAMAVEGSIAVLLPDSASSARWEADDRRFFEQAFDAAGVEYTIVNAEGDARTQQTQAEQAITNGAKVLLLVNLDSGSGAAIIAQAREAGVKVIDYDRLTIEGPGADIYVSFDNVSVGRLMGETLQPVIDGLGLEKPRVVLLNGSPTDNNATLFAEGYKSIADPKFEAGDWEKVDEQAVPDWDNQQALVIYEQILTAAGGEVDATFAANDGLAGSVISALQGQGFDPIPLSGQDATVGGIQNILSGWQTMTVYKPIKLEAAAAAAAAIRLLQGEEPSAITSDVLNNGTRDVPFIKLTPLAVTKDNIAETVIADGFRTWDEICVGEFEAACPEDR